MSERAGFNLMWQRFKEVNVSVAKVGEVIGGKVKVNIDAGTFKNACAIRMSYVLNYSNYDIQVGGWKVVSGEDKKRYIYRVNDLIKYLNKKFGKPDLTFDTTDISIEEIKKTLSSIAIIPLSSLSPDKDIEASPNPVVKAISAIKIPVSSNKGILIFHVDSWADATGHINLWNGQQCSDKDYFDKASKISFWRFKS